MELSNILKVQIKNLWKFLTIFIGFFVALGLVLLIPKTINNTVYELIFSCYFILSLIFAFYVSNQIYGNYAKTFIFIQNNRFLYIVTGIIWNFVISVILTSIMHILKVCSYKDGYILPDFKFLAMTFTSYMLMFNLGTIYSLFFKYHTKNKKILILVLAVIFLVFGYFTLPFMHNLVEVFVNTKNEVIPGWLFLVLVPINILIIVATTLYYCKLNILKAYPN